ncbi:MAG: phosphate transport system protein [Miltoncostaeaceae bacterium]|jgi:phosphate transport system protein|nr:phosphate transport system protein [Miltoncostaeaceae bacterium]
MRRTLQQEFDRLEAAVQDEGRLALRSLRVALRAVESGDAGLADQVIAFDDEVDEIYLEVENGIHSLLARQTPVANDLRLTIALLHDNLHLERIADYCVTIAKLTKLASDLPRDPSLIPSFEEMGRRAGEMIEVALESFARRDLVSATSLVQLDEVINRANRRVAHQLLATGSDPGLREWGLRMLLVSRCLERIGDHAVDIGEQTAFLVTGEFHEFTDASHQAGDGS